MIFGSIDARSPNAPVWTGHPGWIVYTVTTDAAGAAARAAEVAAEHRAPLASGTWPLDTPADTHRIAVGPVYVAVHTRHGHENGAPLATYYVLRRWVADEPADPPDPAWPIPGPRAAAAAAPAASERADGRATQVPARAGAPDPRWPFVAVGHRRSGADAATLGADIITWRGPLGARTITFSTRPRRIEPREASMVSARVRNHDGTRASEFVDVLVHHPLEDDERAELAALAQAHDPRPVIVRCVGEPLQGARPPKHGALTGGTRNVPRPPAPPADG